MFLTTGGSGVCEKSYVIGKRTAELGRDVVEISHLLVCQVYCWKRRSISILLDAYSRVVVCRFLVKQMRRRRKQQERWRTIAWFALIQMTMNREYNCIGREKSYIQVLEKIKEKGREKIECDCVEYAPLRCGSWRLHEARIEQIPEVIYIKIRGPKIQGLINKLKRNFSWWSRHCTL